MIDTVQVIVLALIQGLSEFLPISSSAHLVLPSQVLGWPDQGLLFDVAVHVGTLCAVIAYFWRDLTGLLGDLHPALRREGGYPGELWRLAVATLPAVLAGVTFAGFIESHLRSMTVIASTTLVFGLLLWVAAARMDASTGDDDTPVTYMGALLMGLAQMLALVPGVSRSGVTITAGILLGYSAAATARFSFLMSVPIILGALCFLLLDLLGMDASEVDLAAMALAFAIAAVSAYLTIAFFLRALAKIGLMPFVWYRLLLGLGLFAYILLGAH